MKKLWIFAAIFLAAGAAMLFLPLHMQPTGVVLLGLGLVMGSSAALWLHPSTKKQTASQSLAVTASAGVVILMAAMGIITASGETNWKQAEKADYAIVLGAAVQDNGTASRIMRNRLAAAMEFMEKNPQAKIILSGGQGGDEPETEAKCMYDTLVSMGADPKRLILEDQSHTTRENLMNSMEIIRQSGGTKHEIALITSEFHQRRAAYIADSLDIETCAVSAHTDRWFYRVNYTLREVFAFVKAAFQSGS